MINKPVFFKTIIVVCCLVFLSGCKNPNKESKSDKVENAFFAQREELIQKYSEQDRVFEILAMQADPNDPESVEYWRWRIDQYLYGQYSEYQPLYDAFTANKTFQQIYNMSKEDLGPKVSEPSNLPELPEGYFTENLPGNPHTGWSYISGDTLYITYQGKLTDPYIASYNLKSHVWQGPYKAGESTLSKGDRKIDSHGRPIIEQDSKGHLHIVYGGHGGEREDGLNPLSIDTPHAGGRMLHIISEKPNDISKFDYVADISPYASYTKSYKMANGDIYLFTRAGTHKSPWVYYKMKHGQQTFEPPVILTRPTVQQDNPINVDTFYITPLKISDTEIAISYLWHECNFLEIHDKTHYSRINAYYMRLDTTTDMIFNAQGEEIKLPITLSIANEKMLAFDSTDKKETPFSTKPLILEDNSPALAYQARSKDFSEWRMTAFKEGKWAHSLPMPGTLKRTVKDIENNLIKTITAFETFHSEQAEHAALVVYGNYDGNIILAEATSNNGQDWQVTKQHLVLNKTRIQIKAVKDSSGYSRAVIVALKKGAAQRLYLWHEGKFRGNKRDIPIIAESFEKGGWNATHPRGFMPGINPNLEANFLFNQLQGEHAFKLENKIVRDGQYSAKLIWHHTHPAAFNGKANVVDNVDRKAMFHGHKTPDVMGTEAWYGFSMYFPKKGTKDENNPWLFFQIHGSADKHLNEPSRNPPFSLTLTPDGLQGAWKWDANNTIPSCFLL
ncbi:BNR-4 repeat-containing protein [Rheinheimera sp. UJ51]|uniref:BNR-4 repeat-containing protein n=1 Tax=Rheinheimera sp. UJ51 TaxID=2892446 RepID=UPI001E5B5D88|nr:BNR-4 repeat-containing protein [Rheinheimera sp. UJ51]MCC5453380.1 BNR-4 repeat-containing protein [Rheinheimera sp. UJ51]